MTFVLLSRDYRRNFSPSRNRGIYAHRHAAQAPPRRGGTVEMFVYRCGVSPALLPRSRSRRVYITLLLLLLLLYTFYYSKKKKKMYSIYFCSILTSSSTRRSGASRGRERRIIFVSPITHVIAFRPYLYNTTPLTRPARPSLPSRSVCRFLHYTLDGHA